MKRLRHWSGSLTLLLMVCLSSPAFAGAQETAPATQETAPATQATAAENDAETTATDAAAGKTPVSPAPASPAQQSESRKPMPKLVVTELSKELGRVQRGQRVEVVFELTNAGDAPLKIKGAEPSCGCTVASFDREIAPGESGKVTAKMDTSVLEGAILKSVTVLSNDPALPKVQLLIRAEIVSFVTASPSYARILQVQGAESARTAVNLWASDGTQLEFGSITPTVDWIEARVRKAEPSELREGGPPEQWRLEVSVASTAPLGPLTETLIVPTNHPGQPKVEVPLSGFVRPILATTPANADFGTIGDLPDQRRFLLKLFNFGKPAVTVSNATTDLSFVTATIEPDEPGRRFKVRLQIAEDAPKGKFEGTLRIESDSPLMPVVEVPVHGRIR